MGTFSMRQKGGIEIVPVAKGARLVQRLVSMSTSRVVHLILSNSNTLHEMLVIQEEAGK